MPAIEYPRDTAQQIKELWEYIYKLVERIKELEEKLKEK